MKSALLFLIFLSGCANENPKNSSGETVIARQEVSDIEEVIKDYIEDENPYEKKELEAVIVDLAIADMEDDDDKLLKEVRVLEVDFSELKYRHKYMKSIRMI